jgi:exopolyphosphatase / guanosine-5'-triphosphate,3'-diphosphate pyrophosphatase
VANAWQLHSSEHQQLLIWAAQLHEIGLIVAHNQYHKHGEYLLRNSDLAGFSRQEQALLATLVRGHRRKFPSSVFELLPHAERHLALHLGILLRLAVLLHRSRSLTPLPTLHLETPGAGELCLTFPADWLAQHPLTQADLDNEQLYLAETGFKLRYE